MRSINVFFVLLAASVGAGPPLVQEKATPNPQAMVGKPAPALQVSDWLNTSGVALSLEKLKGKVVVLDFWAYW